MAYKKHKKAAHSKKTKTAKKAHKRFNKAAHPRNKLGQFIKKSAAKRKSR